MRTIDFRRVGVTGSVTVPAYRAATPLTCGAAIDVPADHAQQGEQPGSAGQLDKMFVPGAETSTVVAP